jgi:sodium transport system ATP-binding protein
VYPPESGSTLVDVTEVTKRFGRRQPVTALDSVSLRLPAGSVFALVGENGAGKSTLLRAIAGTITPDGGTVRRPDRIGFLLGNSFGLYDRLTAGEYLHYIGSLRGLSGPFLHQRIRSVAEELDIQGFMDRRCGGFSAGMRQRTALAASILHQPDLLLLDEPTTGLDLVVREHVLAVILRLARSGHSMIISTHHPDEVRQIADGVIIMHAGKIVRILTGSDALADGEGDLSRGATALIRGFRRG